MFLLCVAKMSSFLGLGRLAVCLAEVEEDAVLEEAMREESCDVKARVVDEEISFAVVLLFGRMP